jgi:hypothetical protein
LAVPCSRAEKELSGRGTADPTPADPSPDATLRSRRDAKRPEHLLLGDLLIGGEAKRQGVKHILPVVLRGASVRGQILLQVGIPLARERLRHVAPGSRLIPDHGVFHPRRRMGDHQEPSPFGQALQAGHHTIQARAACGVGIAGLLHDKHVRVKGVDQRPRKSLAVVQELVVRQPVWEGMHAKVQELSPFKHDIAHLARAGIHHERPQQARWGGVVAMMTNEPVKEGSPAVLNALRGVLQDPVQHRTNTGFGVASGHLQVKRQPFGIPEPFRQFLGQGLLPALGLKPVISHGSSAVGAHLREEAQAQAAQGSEPIQEKDVDTQNRSSPGPDAKQSDFDCLPKRGRTYQEKPDSQQKVAAEMGMTLSQLSDAERHVKAAERYPELGAPDVSQSEALRRYKAWEAMTPPKHSYARKAWRAQRQAKRDQVRSMEQGFEDSDHLPKLIGWDLCEQTGELLAQLIRAAFCVKRQQLIELHP